MTISQWIKDHPQRISSLLLIVFSQLQGALALSQIPMSPIVSWAVGTFIGIVMAVLAWNIKNLKDVEPLPTSETQQ